MQARESPNSASAIDSTTRVLPEPVGPRNSKLPTGRPGGFSPARNIWEISTSFSTAWSWPTILRRRAPSKSLASVLRRVGSSTALRTVFIGSGPRLSLLGAAFASWEAESWDLAKFVTFRVPEHPDQVQTTRHRRATSHHLLLTSVR